MFMTWQVIRSVTIRMIKYMLMIYEEGLTEELI